MYPDSSKRHCQRRMANSAAAQPVMLELAAGVALWAAPPPVKYTGIAALALIRALRARVRSKGANSPGPDGGATDGIHLSWTKVSMVSHPERCGSRASPSPPSPCASSPAPR